MTLFLINEFVLARIFWVEAKSNYTKKWAVVCFLNDKEKLTGPKGRKHVQAEIKCIGPEDGRSGTRSYTITVIFDYLIRCAAFPLLIWLTVFFFLCTWTTMTSGANTKRLCSCCELITSVTHLSCKLDAGFIQPLGSNLLMRRRGLWVLMVSPSRNWSITGLVLSQGIQ